MDLLLPVGTRVRGPHGLGTIVEYNTRSKDTAEHLLSERGADFLNVLPLQYTSAVVESLYDNLRFPYIVKFDTGYKDVYSEKSLTVIGDVD